MQILVFSDTHGNYFDMNMAVRLHSRAEVIVHCGDGASQAQRIKAEYPEKTVVSVRGNNDFGSDVPLTESFCAGGKKFFVTHGHYHHVKYGLNELYSAAKENKADIVLFGHTHEAVAEYRSGIYMMNPGSCAGYRATYGLIDIDKNGSVLMNIAKL